MFGDVPVKMGFRKADGAGDMAHFMVDDRANIIQENGFALHELVKIAEGHAGDVSGFGRSGWFGRSHGHGRIGDMRLDGFESGNRLGRRGFTSGREQAGGRQDRQDHNGVGFGSHVEREWAWWIRFPEHPHAACPERFCG